ncbi:MAG: two pore domain potassium channel family protein [Deltaproteobacteria bacterium]|nr:two pore domain potassium channel family protein [Deltaproteobacteria bacterium]MBW2123629.1 two pore domain potassium channel family protein [Deltaproteobacteria bacterium]
MVVPHPFREKFLFLFMSLMLYFVVRPFIEEYAEIGVLLDIFLSLILFSAIYAVSKKRRPLVIGLLIGLPPFIGLWLTHFVESPSLILMEDGFMVLFFGYTTVMFLSYVFRQDEVTFDTIMGAACVYFFIGLMWGFAFAMMESLLPGSFRFGEGQAVGGSNLIYYSFVTQTTLGYGDITPVTTPARSLSVLEAVIGQLYLGVLIARLVGVHISQSSGK